MSDYTVGGQGDSSAHLATQQAQATGASSPSSSSSISNSASLNNLLTAMSTLSANMNANATADGTNQVAGSGSGQDEDVSTGLSDSQRISEKQSGSESGSGEHEEKGSGADRDEINFTGTTLQGSGPVSTSATADVAAGIELRSNQEVAQLNQSATKTNFIQPNTASYATSISTMTTNFSNAAEKYGLSPELTAQVTPSLEKASDLANQLNSLSSQGLATPSITIKYSADIQSCLATASTAVVNEFANNPSTLANTISQVYGFPQENAQKMAENFSAMITNAGAGGTPSSDTAYNPLDTTAGMMTDAMTVGGFAGAAANCTALMSGYTGTLFGNGALFGNDTVSESNATTKNFLNDLQNQENEQKKQEKEAHKKGLLAKIFHPIQSLTQIASPVMVHIGAEMIHAVYPKISVKDATKGLNDVSMKFVSSELSKGMKFVANGAAGALSKMTGLHMSAALDFVNESLKFAANPMGTMNQLAMEGLGKAIVAMDPGSKGTISQAEKIGGGLMGAMNTATSDSPLTTPQQRMQAGESFVTQAMNDSAQGLASFFCLFPGANREAAEIAATAIVMVVMVAASFFCPEAIEADASLGAGLAGEAGEDATTAASTIVSNLGSEGEVLNAVPDVVEEVTENTSKLASVISKGQEGVQDTQGGGSTSSSAGSASEGNAADNADNANDISEESEGRSAITPGDGAAEDADEVSTASQERTAITSEDGAQEDASIASSAEDLSDVSTDFEERSTITAGDGAAEDAKAASSAKNLSELEGPKGMSSQLKMALAMQAVTFFQAAGSIANDVMTILQNITEIDIAHYQYDAQINNSILQMLNATTKSIDQNTNYVTSNESSNISNQNNANATMTQNAASTVNEIPG